MERVSYFGSLCGCILALMSFFGTRAQKKLSLPELNQQLVQAIEKDDLLGVQNAIEAGAQADFYDKKSKSSALIFAIEKNNPQIVVFLLANVPSDGYDAVFDQKDSSGDTAFLKAVKNNTPRMVDLLLYKASPEVRQKMFKQLDANKKVALDYATSSDDFLQVLYELLFWGVPINQKNKKGQTPEQYARSVGNVALGNALGYVEKLREQYKVFVDRYIWKSDRSLNTFEAEVFLRENGDFLDKWGRGIAALFVVDIDPDNTEKYLKFLLNNGVTFSTPVFGRYLLSRAIDYERWDKLFDEQVSSVIQEGTNANLKIELYGK